jgi:hypothetical protein
LIEELKIPAGSRIRMGKAARPLPQDIQQAIRNGLATVPGIVEVHLPLCEIVGTMPEPDHMLLAAFQNEAAVAPGMEAIGKILKGIFQEPKHLDVIPLVQGDPLISMARKANSCLIAAPRQWWRFWE